MPVALAHVPPSCVCKDRGSLGPHCLRKPFMQYGWGVASRLRAYHPIASCPTAAVPDPQRCLSFLRAAARTDEERRSRLISFLQPALVFVKSTWLITIVVESSRLFLFLTCDGHSDWLRVQATGKGRSVPVCKCSSMLIPDTGEENLLRRPDCYVALSHQICCLCCHRS